MGLMDLFGKKSRLVDSGKSPTNIPGKLSGAPQMSAEGDFSAWFIPDDKKYLLNSRQAANPNGMLELKVKVEPPYKQAFLDAVSAMAGRPVFASGVMVDNEALGGKAELHPLDLLYAPLPDERFPGWFREIVGNVPDPRAAWAYKIAAASDASRAHKPPRAADTRTLQAAFSYPDQPNLPKIKVDFELRKIADLKTDFQLSNDLMRRKILLELSVSGSGQGGPGVFVGDMVAYWRNE